MGGEGDRQAGQDTWHKIRALILSFAGRPGSHDFADVVAKVSHADPSLESSSIRSLIWQLLADGELGLTPTKRLILRAGDKTLGELYGAAFCRHGMMADHLINLRPRTTCHGPFNLAARSRRRIP